MVEAGIQMLTDASPSTPSGAWDWLRAAMGDCLVSLNSG